MCLAVPAKVIEIGSNNLGVVELSGVRRQISLELVDNVCVGDYVIIHVGYALQRLDAAEAEKTLDMFQQLFEAGEQVP